MAIWNIDPTHTTVEFVATHMMFTKVRGRFEALEGVIHYDPAAATASSVRVTINAASLNTGVGDRDNHLRSADFLNVQEFPHITFVSTSVTPTGDNRAIINGDLTIRGVTRGVSFEAAFEGTGRNPFGKTVAAFSATTKINREDYGLTWNVVLEAGGVLVSKDIQVNLDVQAVLQEEAQPA